MPTAVRAAHPRDASVHDASARDVSVRAHNRRASSSNTRTRTRPWLPATLLVAGPLFGAVLGEAVGGYHGPLFVVLTVASAALATAAATPNGRWWVLPAQPPLAWLVAAGAELLWHDPPYSDAKARAVGLVHATTHVFPVIVAALAVSALVIVVPAAAARLGGRPRGGRRA